MRTAILSEVCDIRSGGTPSRSQSSFYNGGIPWAKISDIEASDGELIRTEESLTDEGLQSIRGRIFPPGTLLFAMYGSVGKMTFTTTNTSTNQAILGIQIARPDLLDPRYLFRWLEGQKASFENDAKGIAQKNLSAGYVRDLKISLPPLDEQKRIAAILDQADSLRRLRQRSLDRLNTLSQAIFYEMFGDPATAPKKWKNVQLGDIVRPGDKINYGVVQPGEDVEVGVPLIRVGDLLAEYIDPLKVKQIDAAIERNYKRSRLIGDEILIGCVGSIGTVALAHEGLRGANIARAVARVPIDADFAARDFIAEQIKTPFVQRYFAAETRTVAQPTLNIGLIVNAPIFLPPIDLQIQFSARIADLAKILKIVSSAQDTEDNLFASLQHRAFRGEL